MNSVVGSPGSTPDASRKMFATPPDVRTVSTTSFSSRCRATAIESSAFTPPRWATFGWSGFRTAWVSIVSSRSMTRPARDGRDRKSTRLNSSHANISYAVFCLKKKKSMQALLSKSSPAVRCLELLKEVRIKLVLNQKNLTERKYVSVLPHNQHRYTH